MAGSGEIEGARGPVQRLPGEGQSLIQSLGVIVNADKPKGAETARALVAALLERGIRPTLNLEGARLVGHPELAARHSEDLAAGPFLVVLGGDGTLLRAAKAHAPMPVLGINTGRLGFLTDLEPDQVLPHLDSYLAGRYSVEERMMLSAHVERGSRRLDPALALNDAVIRTFKSRMVTVVLLVGENRIASFPADGVIFATPTGSTAYSLSSGGPIAQPTLESILITPISPHTFNSRPLVLRPDEVVNAVVESGHHETVLTVDGQFVQQLQRGDRVVIRRATAVARLVRRSSSRFFDVLRQKLTGTGLGGRED